MADTPNMSLPDGTNQSHAIHIETDSEDGGIPLEDDSMQIDSPEDSPGYFLQLAGGEIDFIDYGAEGMGDGAFPLAPRLSMQHATCNMQHATN